MGTPLAASQEDWQGHLEGLEGCLGEGWTEARRVQGPLGANREGY